MKKFEAFTISNLYLHLYFLLLFKGNDATNKDIGYDYADELQFLEEERRSFIQPGRRNFGNLPFSQQKFNNFQQPSMLNAKRGMPGKPAEPAEAPKEYPDTNNEENAIKDEDLDVLIGAIEKPLEEALAELEAGKNKGASRSLVAVKHVRPASPWMQSSQPLGFQRPMKIFPARRQLYPDLEPKTKRKKTIEARRRKGGRPKRPKIIYKKGRGKVKKRPKKLRRELDPDLEPKPWSLAMDSPPVRRQSKTIGARRSTKGVKVNRKPKKRKIKYKKGRGRVKKTPKKNWKKGKNSFVKEIFVKIK